MNLNRGYLYVVDGQRWARETLYAVKQLRTLSKLPICIVSSELFGDIQQINEAYENIFILIVEEIKNSNFISKVVGMINSPFENTMYMDTDTYVVYNIDKIFDVLNLCDMAMKIEASNHTGIYPVNDVYQDFVPEYNSGVVLFKKNEIVQCTLENWKTAIVEQIYSKEYFDMPQFRSTFINVDTKPIIFTLSENFNMSGLRTYKIIHGRVFIIHERFGTFWFSHSEKMLNNAQMHNIATRINKTNQKRLFIPYFNFVVPTSVISLAYIVNRIKVCMGFPKIKKSKAFS